MAIKAFMLRKKLDLKRKEADVLRAKFEDLEKREAETTAVIDEITDNDQMAAVEETVNALKEERTALEKEQSEMEAVISGLEKELDDAEKEQDPVPKKNPAPEEMEEEKEERTMNKLFTVRDRLAQIVTRDDVKAYLGEVRTAIKEKRALTNVGLLVPEVMLGLLRENITEYSKLYKHVNVRPISGTGRQVIMGTVPEAIWTDCCANLNELTLGFNDLEIDCYKVAGYFAVCNANLEDADIDLAGELLRALGQAIGLALDKAILFGRNASATMKMPQGIVSRLAQTEAPTGYPATARTWVDLHTANMISIPAATTGAALIAAIVTASGAAKGKYARGAKVWVMNETTYTALMAATVTTDVNGRIVTGVADQMPVVGGVIEVLDFMPDNLIVGGYFDLYTLAERAGTQFASSEHVRFLADQTVMKGIARYDGAPAIPEAFVAIGIKGATPAATMTFAQDTAN